MAAVQKAISGLAGFSSRAPGVRASSRAAPGPSFDDRRRVAERWTRSCETDARSWSSSGRRCSSTRWSCSAPIVWSLVYTFFSGNVITGFKYVGLAQLPHADPRPGLLAAFKFTLKYAVVVTVLQVGFGLLLALLYVFYLRRGSALVRTLVFFPVVLPTVAIAQLFAKMFAIAPQYGLVNSALHALGIERLDPGLARRAAAAPSWCSS